MQQAADVVYVGHVPHGDSLALIRGAEVVLLPSRSEGLPRVILEAVALRTKVVCPPGIPEFERHMARYVLPEVNVDSIVRTLNAVWECDDLPSYPFSEHRVSRVVEDLAQVYREALPNSRPTPTSANSGR